MRTVSGIITAVQEGRFRLASREGQNKLFILSHKAPLAPQDLPPLQRDETEVTIHFEVASDLIAGIAHDITPATPAR